jgi:hypothetical protein
MFRQTLDAGSMNVATLVTANAGIRMQYRASTGATTAHPANYPALGDPYWVRLTRLDDTYISEMSPDGQTWTELGRVTIVMGATIYVGLPVTSFVDGTLATAVFTNVSVIRPTGLPGDADGNGLVDAGDAAIMAAHWGRTGMSQFDGDFNDDGTVSAADASILAANWGATLPESSEPATPDEPLPAEPTVSPVVGPVRSRPGTVVRTPLAPSRLSNAALERSPAARSATLPPTNDSLVSTPLSGDEVLLADLSLATSATQNRAAHDAALSADYGPQASDASPLARNPLAWTHTLSRRRSR